MNSFEQMEDASRTFDRKAEELGHQLRRGEDGNIDHFVCDVGYHNGPGCVICHANWCQHCSGPDDIKPCDGGAAHEAYERAKLAELMAKYGPAAEADQSNV